MNLIEKIKNFIIRNSNKKPRISSTDIVGYDTNLVYIPKYKDLTDEEKKQVDKYIQETDTTKMENVILYGSEMNKYSQGITEILLNVGYKADEEYTMDNVKKLTIDHILNLRINAMIAKEEMSFYENLLKNLQREATLRTVALEQVYKKEQKNFKIFGIFEKAERIRRQQLEEVYETSIERMKISKKIIEQQIQSVINSSVSNNKLADIIRAYTSILKDSDVEKQKREILRAKKQKLLEFIKVVLPKEALDADETLDEETEIKEIAKLKAKLEIYAYTKKEEINQLRQRIIELDAMEKADQNREELLKELHDIKIKYKIFERYIKEEDLEGLYKVKFDVLTSDINRKAMSPFLGMKQDDEEFKYYNQIIQNKIEQIVTAQNPEIKRAFGENGLQQAVMIIKNILKNGKKTFETESILKDRTLLSLILSFDNKKAFERMTINKNNADSELYELVFELEDMIPLKSIFQFEEGYNNSISTTDNEYLQLYRLYNEQQLKETTLDNCDYFKLKTYIMPEGIIKIKKLDEFFKKRGPYRFESEDDSFSLNKERYNKLDNFIHKIRTYAKVIMPSTLREIEKGVLNNCSNFYEIELNEGLEEIGDEAFSGCSNLGRYKNMKCPTSLRKIGKKAFFDCCNMATIILNEGLTTIGQEAFNWSWNNILNRDERLRTPTNIIILPSSVNCVGANIVYGGQVTNLGLKNYKGQKIPQEVWDIWYREVRQDESRPWIQKERTLLKSIYFFEGDSLEPYKEIDPWRLLCQYKNYKLAEIYKEEQER